MTDGAAANGTKETWTHTNGALHAEKGGEFTGLAIETSVFSHIGGRKAQEDRYCIAPKLIPGVDRCSFFGVFDGTVGDFASDHVKDLVIPKLQ